MILEILVENVNESTRRFKAQLAISGETVEYPDSSSAQRSPIARKLFGFPWTDGVRVGTDFIEVRKQDWVDWEVLEEPLRDLIEEHLRAAAQAGQVEENPPLPEPRRLDSPIAQQVQVILDQEVNPSVASHGGHITLLDVTDNRVYVRLEGGCQGCAMSQATLKEGIERTIRSHIPSIQEVLDTTDHAAGTNPYYVG